MTFRREKLCACLLVLGFCMGASSDDQPLEQHAGIVSKALASLAASYNACDPKGLAEQFTPNGEFIDADGNAFAGRDAIAREFTALFEINPRNRAEMTAEAIREISPGILSVDTVATLTGATGSEAIKVDFGAIFIQQADGRWLLGSVHSKGERSVRSAHARLKQLEWLIGDWVDESDESTMHMSTRWSEDANFIVTQFHIQIAGRNVMSGTERIGWDASLEKFRSWVFDSKGGFASGMWTKLDDRWVVKSTGVSSDGDACSATHTYERKGPDAFLFSVTDRLVGDGTPPEFTSNVVRKPPDPQAGPKAANAPSGKSSSR